MPFKSDAQRRWAHTVTGTKALGGPAKVKEWDDASKGADLPERVAPPKLKLRGAQPEPKRQRVILRKYGPAKKRTDVVAPAALR